MGDLPVREEARRSRFVARLRVLFDLGRIVRYGISGSTAALTHLSVLTALVELAGMRPVWASNVGFGCGLVVSYTLQRRWVFATTARHLFVAPKFLTVTGIGLLLNTIVMYLGTEVAELPYYLAQLVAFAVIPFSNFVLNSVWTFR